jgi:hypothetical protein
VFNQRRKATVAISLWRWGGDALNAGGCETALPGSTPNRL